MDGQENQEQVSVEPEKKRRGRPAKTIQTGVTIVDNPTVPTVTEKEQDAVVAEETKKKRGRKPKYKTEFINLNPVVEEMKRKAKKRSKQRVLKKKTTRRKSCGKGFNILSILSGFKMSKIKINLSGVKLPKGLTWHDVQIWSVAMAAIIAIALAK
jgi:hypothetical protein